MPQPQLAEKIGVQENDASRETGRVRPDPDTKRLLSRASMKIIDPGYLTKREASAYTSLSPRSLDAAKARGELAFYRFSSRRVLFSQEDLDRWLSTMRIAAGERK
jgi:excisionase family DNA binding protein